MIVDFRLQVFLTVARTLSFTKAAAILNISQPAISKHIKEFEIEVKQALFNRQGSRISLTQKGKEVVPYVQAILDQYAHLRDVIQTDTNSFEGTLYIGASTTIAHYVLPSILAEFNKHYPKIKLSVRSANSDEIVHLLQRREIEIAIVEDNETHSEIHYSYLASDEIVLVSSNIEVQSKTIEQLPQLPLLIREEGSGTLSAILSALKGAGVLRKNLNINMQLGSNEAIIRYLLASKAYAFLSILVAKDYISRGQLVEVEVDGLNIIRKFRFGTLHGEGGRIVSIFRDFCLSHYNHCL